MKFCKSAIYCVAESNMCTLTPQTVTLFNQRCDWIYPACAPYALPLGPWPLVPDLLPPRLGQPGEGSGALGSEVGDAVPAHARRRWPHPRRPLRRANIIPTNTLVGSTRPSRGQRTTTNNDQKHQNKAHGQEVTWLESVRRRRWLILQGRAHKNIMSGHVHLLIFDILFEYEIQIFVVYATNI